MCISFPSLIYTHTYILFHNIWNIKTACHAMPYCRIYCTHVDGFTLEEATKSANEESKYDVISTCNYKVCAPSALGRCFIEVSSSSSSYSVYPTISKLRWGLRRVRCRQPYLYPVGVERLLPMRPPAVKKVPILTCSL